MQRIETIGAKLNSRNSRAAVGTDYRENADWNTTLTLLPSMSKNHVENEYCDNSGLALTARRHFESTRQVGICVNAEKGGGRNGTGDIQL